MLDNWVCLTLRSVMSVNHDAPTSKEYSVPCEYLRVHTTPTKQPTVRIRSPSSGLNLGLGLTRDTLCAPQVSRRPIRDGLGAVSSGVLT